ncbi:MAG: hypothetical protein ACYTJ0_12910, partial [Planctomycetota bacterium]
VRRTVRLRLALIALLEGRKAEQDALADFARGQEDADLRNRAAIVLAVQGRPEDAIDLFVVRGEGTRRFRDESRVAEWAIRAEDAETAKRAAGAAVGAAELRRDRRYALSLLVEAHRLDDSLPSLVEDFAARESLTDEERQVWIDVLRELARYDEAIRLFRESGESGEGGFTIEMRRELLEMERETGREDRLVESYRRLIDAEPDELTWRSGLAQALLEQGDREAAIAAWPEWIARLTSGARLLETAQAQASLGLDDLAEATVRRMLELDVDTGPALLFLAGIHRDRGRLVEAERTLDRLDEMAEARDAVRFELAEAYEQLGRQKKAVAVMEGIRAARTEVAEDLEMRLAWLYSEIGEEDTALERWRELWRRVNSVARRRYVEDRLMSVASRLGKLADIAVDMEEKLLDGTADERESGLLVRIYTRVGDPVSATEVLGEYMRQQGRAAIDTLTEKARIYFLCEDYYNYEKTIRAMIEIDPEGEGEYLRQLAMSQLERGRADEARAVLSQLRDVETDSVSREFEAGVLTLAGMREEAAEAYRRGVAEHPDRIESYLLLANLMRDLGQTTRAVGMFQFLAETADRDDLFTIAIDGLLNLQAGRAVIEWARRITLERLAGREDKNYLYQLLADLSEEATSKEGQIRALENSIAVSGTRRLSVLRECMDLSSNMRGGVYYAPGRGPSTAGNERFFAFGRRLIGLQEAVPPQVFLDLGRAFLDDGDIRSASRTFSLARNLPDERAYRRQVAEAFEKASQRREALRVYERLLRVSPSDVGLIAKVAQLHEQEGRDEVAYRFYERGLDLLVRQAPLTTLDREDAEPDTPYAFYWARNRDAYDTYRDRIVRGLLVTLPDDGAVDAAIAAHREALQQELALLDEERAAGVEIEQLDSAPRILRRTRALRRLLIAFDRVAEADRMDLDLLARFPDDETLLASLARTRLEWGYYDSARRLAGGSGRDDEARREVRVMLGEEFDELATDLVNPDEGLRQLVPMLVSGDRAAARSLMRRVDLSALGKVAGSMYIVSGVATFQADPKSPVQQYLRVARRLDDGDLVLRFARGWIRTAVSSNESPLGIVHAFDRALDLVDEEHREGFCRFVADLILEKPERQGRYVALLERIGEVLGEPVLDPEQLLEAIEEASPAFGWQIPAVDFITTVPESIRAQATERVLQRTPEGQRVAALLPVPFELRMPLDDQTARIVRDYFKGDLTASRDKGQLNYIAQRLQAGPTPCRDLANAELALEMFDELAEFIPPKEADAIRARRSIIYRQLGRTEEALAIAVELHDGPQPPPDAYGARNARTELFGLMIPEHPEAFLDAIDRKARETGASVELTDRRLALIRTLNDPERLRTEHLRAIETHPEENKYREALARLDVRSGRLRSAVAINRQITEILRSRDIQDESGPTVEDLISAIAQEQAARSGGRVDASVFRPGLERRAADGGLDGLIEWATRLGIS